MTKIIYDNCSRNSVINSLNGCIGDLSVVNDIFYNIDVPYDFKFKSVLNDVKDELKKTNENISLYKNDINRHMEEINKNELEILSLINKMDDSFINKF